MRRVTRIDHSLFGAQVAFARAATGLGVKGLGVMAVARRRSALWRSGC